MNSHQLLEEIDNQNAASTQQHLEKVAELLKKAIQSKTSEQINAIFFDLIFDITNQITKHNFLIDLFFPLLIKSGANDQILNVFTIIANTIKHQTRDQTAYSAFKMILEKQDDTLARAALDIILKSKDEITICCCFTYLVRNNRTDLLNPTDSSLIIDREAIGGINFVSSAKELDDGNYRLEALERIASKIANQFPDAQLKRSLFSTTNEYFKALLRNPRELFLALTNSPALITEKDECGNTLSQFSREKFFTEKRNNLMHFLVSELTFEEKQISLIKLLINKGKMEHCIETLWKLFKLDKLEVPTTTIDRSAFNTIADYFKSLLSEPYELFLALANQPYLITEKDENGDTLVHLFCKEFYHNEISGHLLAFAPNLDLGIVDANGNNALHVSIQAYYKFIYAYHILSDLLIRAKENKTALNAFNNNGLTPTHVMLTAQKFSNPDDMHSYLTSNTINLLLDLVEAGSDLTLAQPGLLSCKEILDAFIKHAETRSNTQASEIFQELRNVCLLNEQNIHEALRMFVESDAPSEWVHNKFINFLHFAYKKGVSFNQLNQNDQTPFFILLSKGSLSSELTLNCAYKLLEFGGNPFQKALSILNNPIEVLLDRINEMEAFYNAESPWETYKTHWKAYKEENYLNKRKWTKTKYKTERLNELQQLKENWDQFKQKALSQLQIENKLSPETLRKYCQQEKFGGFLTSTATVNDKKEDVLKITENTTMPRK